MQIVSVRVVQDKRMPIVLLSLSGFDDARDAKGEILKHLWVVGVDGDGGKVESVKADKEGIDIETDLCGFGIEDEDIERAMRMNGTEHVC